MKRPLIAGVLLTVMVVTAWTVQSATKLFINGTLSSSGVIERNGVAYVPLKDVAAMMHLTVSRTARGYELSDAGGANQQQGVTGKVGDWLWNGYARFQVVKVIRTKKYINQFSGDSQEITPYPEGNDLLIVVCKLKNGTPSKVTALIPGGESIGLADSQDHSYGPRVGIALDASTRGADLLTGASCDFALTFDIPAKAEIKDLVYEPEFFGLLKASEKKFRVSLGNPKLEG